jgi:hypothetical protein
MKTEKEHDIHISGTPEARAHAVALMRAGEKSMEPHTTAHGHLKQRQYAEATLDFGQAAFEHKYDDELLVPLWVQQGLWVESSPVRPTASVPRESLLQMLRQGTEFGPYPVRSASATKGAGPLALQLNAPPGEPALVSAIMVEFALSDNVASSNITFNVEGTFIAFAPNSFSYPAFNSGNYVARIIARAGRIILLPYRQPGSGRFYFTPIYHAPDLPILPAGVTFTADDGGGPLLYTVTAPALTPNAPITLNVTAGAIGTECTVYALTPEHGIFPALYGMLGEPVSERGE